MVKNASYAGDQYGNNIFTANRWLLRSSGELYKNRRLTNTTIASPTATYIICVLGSPIDSLRPHISNMLKKNSDHL